MDAYSYLPCEWAWLRCSLNTEENLKFNIYHYYNAELLTVVME